MLSKNNKKLPIFIIIIVIIIAGGIVWFFYGEVIQKQWRLFRNDVPEGFALSNGRLEAEEIDISTKYPGRVAEVLFHEGDFVDANEVVARMDTKTLQAQLKQAEAKVEQAKRERDQAIAVVQQRESELALAEKELNRSFKIYKEDPGAVSVEKVDRERSRVQTANAAHAAAEAQLATSEAIINAAIAETERLKVDIEDGVLRAPRRVRVQYRLAEPGEVLGAGGKIYTTIDLTDVYMTLFFPETIVGRIAIGAQARIIFDAAPELVIPAKVSFVDAKSQFTPKTVETRTEREKLMFRTKVKIDPELLKKYEPIVKTGLPGVAYVRLNPDIEWPVHLQPKLPKQRANEF